MSLVQLVRIQLIRFHNLLKESDLKMEGIMTMEIKGTPAMDSMTSSRDLISSGSEWYVGWKKHSS